MSSIVTQRPSSRRTRIKTFSIVNSFHNPLLLRDHLPEEQGLRQCFKYLHMHLQLRDHLPEEQGLRLCTWVAYIAARALRDHLPEEQGLRQPLNYSTSRRTEAQRPSSRRTRIKTEPSDFASGPCSLLRDHLPEEQGLRQSQQSNSSARLQSSETIFQKNKD